MPEEHSKILKYNQNQKSMMISFVIYVDMESLINNKIPTCNNNPHQN